MAYKLTDHIHEREISRHLGHTVNLYPMLRRHFRGIHLTVNAAIDSEVEPNELRRYVRCLLSKEPLVKICSDPQVSGNAGQHYACVGNFTTASVDGNHRVVVTATIDNLLKGAATSTTKCQFSVWL